MALHFTYTDAIAEDAEVFYPANSNPNILKIY